MRGRDGVLGPLQPRLLLHPGQTLPLRGLHSRPGPGGVLGGCQVLELYCTVLYCTVLYRCWSCAGTEYLVGSVRRARAGLVCSVNNQGRTEHHHEFWTLVAGQELVWRDCADTDTLDTLPNKVKIAGSESSEGGIGLFEDMVGTVNKCQVGAGQR